MVFIKQHFSINNNKNGERMAKERKPPVLFGWELTLKCNMNCKHCGSIAGESRTKELTTQEALNLCEKLKQFKIKSVGITGGEAILRDDWAIIVKKLRDYGIKVSILSNGWAITDDMIKQFKELGVSMIAISIDGGTPQTHDYIRGISGSFNKCIKTLAQLKKEHIPTTVVTTVHKGNIAELPKLKDILIGKTSAWQLQIAVPFGRFPKDQLLSKEEYYSLAMFIAATRRKISRKRLVIIGAHSIGYHSNIVRNTMANPIWAGCQAGISTMAIQSNGNVKGCLSLPDEFVEGNIKKIPVKEIWNDPNAFSYTRKFKKTDLKNDCIDCKYGKTCKGGCTTVSSRVSGEPHCNPYCLYQIEKEMIAK